VCVVSGDIGNSRYLLPSGNLVITTPNADTDTGVFACSGSNPYTSDKDIILGI